MVQITSFLMYLLLTVMAVWSGPTADAHPGGMTGGATENLSDVPAPMQGPFHTFTAPTRSNGFDQAPDLDGGEAMTSSSGH